MKLTPILTLAFVAATAFGAKPQSCPRYAATVYVATSAAYALSGDATAGSLVWIDGIPYTKYVDGEGGVEAYVNGGTVADYGSGSMCTGTFFFNISRTGTRKLNVVFHNWLNNGVSGPPRAGQPGTTTAGSLFLRGFSFAASGPGATYTTMLPVNGLAIGGVLRYEPLASDYLSDVPDFPVYYDMNTPCVTSAARMTVLSATETLVTPDPATCSTYLGPVLSLMMQQRNGGSLVNVGQYGMDFRFRIVVDGRPRF